jgi:hypothetical protein
MLFVVLKHFGMARCSAAQVFILLCAALLPLSPARAETSFPCELFFGVSSDFLVDGSSKVRTLCVCVDSDLSRQQGLQCNVRFFCLNSSAACACSDASQPMFSFDLPFAFSADDDLQTGLKSGDVVGQKWGLARWASSHPFADNCPEQQGQCHGDISRLRRCQPNRRGHVRDD